MKFERKLALLREACGVEPVQYAALCTRRKGKRTEVLLITSRDTGRWILPKGWPMEGKTGAEAALIEAWEEAGVIGHLTGPPVGSYASQKVLIDSHPMPCRVEVHPVHVEKLAARFPEKGQRRRKWTGVKKAAKLVIEPELAAILRRLRKG